MIIPNIQVETTADCDSLIDQIKHWSLFNKTVLSGVTFDEIEVLEKVIQQVGGLVDLGISPQSFDEDALVRCLNAGASFVVDSGETIASDVIPEDRRYKLVPDDSQDAAIPKGSIVYLDQPTSARIGELEMARIDALVDVEKLSPELMTDALCEVLVTDRPDGLWSTVIVDPLGIALGLAYSNKESLLHALTHRVGTYWSRSRNDLWIKGETSGATQHLINVRFDCDRDCLRFMVTQDPPGFCHRETHTCFGEERTIQAVIQRLQQRMGDSDEKSFTRKLANDAEMLEKKLLEEAKELSEASQAEDTLEVAWEAADVLYFSLVAMLKNGVTLDCVYSELARRMNRVVRRKNKLEEDG